MKISTKQLTIAGVLSALAIIIPMIMPRLPFPEPFSFTVLSHVPVIIAMFISPLTGIFVEICATLGFFLRGVSPVIIARAAVQIVFVVAGAYMIKGKINIVLIGLVTMILHGLCEAMIAVPFGFEILPSLITVGGGTAIHHIVDFSIALIIANLINKSGALYIEGISLKANN